MQYINYNFDFAPEFVSKVFMVNLNTARDAWNMVDKVVRICLGKHAGGNNEKDVAIVKGMIVQRLIDEIENPSYFNGHERCSVQTCIVVMAREITLNYVRNAHYSSSSVSDIFKSMNVDVSGAESYLDGLDEMFTPSQKCVLRLLYGEGCSVDQAAGMLGVSAGEVRSLQWQAMESLQKRWQVLRDGLGRQ